MQSASEDATPQRESDLSPLSLADGALENVTKCGDCGKPVLQSAKEEHAGAFRPLDLLASCLSEASCWARLTSAASRR